MIVIRVRAKTDPADFRNLSVARQGGVATCDCGGFDGLICSHIDAVLLSGERAMVHADDHLIADEAAEIWCGIVVPEYWKGTWRRNMRWRGLSRAGATRRVRQRDKPLVCFTGKFPGFERTSLVALARENGWETIDSASPSTDVLVAADPTAKSAKLKAARKHGTTIVTPDEWSLLMMDGVLPDE